MADDRKFASVEFHQVDSDRIRKGTSYEEFLRTPSMHCGIYVLEAGSDDPQSPHEEDELYYVESGRGRFKTDSDDIAVKPGTLIYVRAGEEHRFHSITEDLRILVIFSTFQRSRAE